LTPASIPTRNYCPTESCPKTNFPQQQFPQKMLSKLLHNKQVAQQKMLTKNAQQRLAQENICPKKFVAAGANLEEAKIRPWPNKFPRSTSSAQRTRKPGAPFETKPVSPHKLCAKTPFANNTFRTIRFPDKSFREKSVSQNQRFATNLSHRSETRITACS
jgi:hypothetical protein